MPSPSLGPETEELITRYLARLNPELTIVMVSQRQSALKYCDAFYRLEQGRLVQDDFVRTHLQTANLK